MVIYDVQAIRIVTGVPVKVLGWIKSAVGFITTPAGPRKDGPLPEVPPEIDRGAAASDAEPDTIEIAAESVSLGPERRIEVESESLVGVEPAGATGIEAGSRISLEPEGLEPRISNPRARKARKRSIVAVELCGRSSMTIGRRSTTSRRHSRSGSMGPEAISTNAWPRAARLGGSTPRPGSNLGCRARDKSEGAPGFLPASGPPAR